ncbi:MAG: phosphoribosylamine--glycine ligase [Nitrospirae bacterium]|nr:phosphoribosylamine--glycine ligase [Candidatus Manganitrophaceae bacterium]
MNVLVIGGGGREHALVWKIAQSPRVRKLYCAPGNPGIAAQAEIVPVAVDEVEKLLAFAKEKPIDLTVVGPELPLSHGIVDRFEAHGLRIFGPHRAAAEIETSKVFSKKLMQKYQIPTAAAEVVTLDEAYARITSIPMPVVLKVEGLAAGKGVVIARDLKEAKEGLDGFRSMGEAANRIILERYLKGIEATFFVITDGIRALPLASAQDHKRIYDGDQGPNTGGMGAISPTPRITPEIEAQVMERIIYPTLRGLAAEGTPYRGVLYAGLMLTSLGPHVLEFNARWGDPETQAVLPRLKTDWVDVMEAALDHRLDQMKLEWREEAAVCIVLASEGYPGPYQKGEVISGLDRIDLSDIVADVVVFHAGTARRGEEWITQGGRVLGVTALGKTVPEARRRAYQAVDCISFRGMQYRKDIGASAE